MNKCVYKINFGMSIKELDDIYEFISDIEKEKVFNLSTDGFFDYTGPYGDYVGFLIATPIDIEKYINILSNNYINTKLLDLSNDILNGKYNLEKDLSHLVNDIDSLKFEFFIEDIKDWILENLDIDMVLDRISEVGIKNINDIEKEFLKKYKNK